MAPKRKRPPDHEIAQDRARQTTTWTTLKRRLRDAVGLIRALIFIQCEDERVCLKLRGFLNFNLRIVSWMALLKSKTELTTTLQGALQDLQSCMRGNAKEDLNERELQAALTTILAHLLRGDATEFRPLVDKLPAEAQQTMERLLGAEYTQELSRDGALQDLAGFQSWFSLRKRTPERLIHRSLAELQAFPHVPDWVVDEGDHSARRDAYKNKSSRAEESTALTIRHRGLKKERATRQEQDAWSSDNEQAYERELKEIKQENSALLKEKKLLARRTRKYRLFPTRSQQKTLRQFMGTCRWTYNQAVAHFRATNESNAIKLTALYVTKNSKKTRTYPDGMSPPPEWAFDTPNTMRSNIMRTFQTNVKSAFSNLRNGNINKFKIQFSSKKRSPDFTFSENGRNATIEQKQSTFYLSISKLKNIRVKMDRLGKIESEIDILFSNGFWYVAIPAYVEPDPYEYRGTCIALDPGTKAFMTGVDLEGNVLEFGRDNKTRLISIRDRRDASQRAMSKFKNKKKEQKGTSKRWQYRAYVRAKRTFISCTSKLKNCVKELHYKTCAYLTKHHDVILLPIFQTKEMVKKSNARNHGFNKSMLSLNHFKFQQLLQAKCATKGKSVVVCSEMYTSRTCGQCYRLHVKLGSNDVFTCPHCSYSAGRDVNAAMNILRYVSAGSLQVYG